MSDHDNEMLKFKTEVELRLTEMRKNHAEAILNEKKTKYYPLVAVALPIVISLLALIVTLTK
jgi:hypothetical protein